jgi:transposase
LKFLRKINRETPKDKTLHFIANNDATHKHPAVQEWLTRHPRLKMHFTPASASWLNMVQRCFRDITVNRLRRGVFTSVPELIAAIDKYVAHHNTKPKPFIWTKSTARACREGLGLIGAGMASRPPSAERRVNASRAINGGEEQDKHACSPDRRGVVATDSQGSPGAHAPRNPSRGRLVAWPGRVSRLN